MDHLVASVLQPVIDQLLFSYTLELSQGSCSFGFYGKDLRVLITPIPNFSNLGNKRPVDLGDQVVP